MLNWSMRQLPGRRAPRLPVCLRLCVRLCLHARLPAGHGAFR